MERPVFTHSDVKPGMLVRAQVIVVEPFGAIVQLESGVKALCPYRHMSELERVKPTKKFKVCTWRTPNIGTLHITFSYTVFCNWK